MKILLSLLFTISILACNDNDDTNTQECPDNLICTEEFRSITIDIENTNGEPIELDSAIVTNIDTGQKIEFTRFDIFPLGTYVIADDALLESLDKDGNDFSFEGFITGEKVVDEMYVVGHDCCHVILIEGEQNLVLDL